METIKCSFVSVWDGGTKVETKATFNSGTGEVRSLETASIEDLDVLDREYIEFPDGSVMDVCTSCHEYVLDGDGDCRGRCFE